MSKNQTPDSGTEQGHGARPEEAGMLESLRTSEIRYRRLFESAKDGILILDAETGMVTDVNPYILDLIGYSRAEVLRKKIWELGFLADVVANEARFQQLRQEKYVRYENLALEGHDGKRHEAEFISNVYLEGNHKVIQCNVRDISERKRHEANAKDLLQVLRAVRNVNQLITHEKERDGLLRHACHILAETRSYRSAWIALLDGTAGLRVITESGGGGVLEAFRSSLEPERWPECCRRALEGDGIVVMRDTQQNCSTCELEREHRATAALAVGLRHGGWDHGVLVVALPQDVADDPQEQSLFQELAGDIGYALHNIRAEDALWHSRAILRAVLDNIPARVFWKDRDLDYLGCNLAFARDAGFEDPQQLVGKDDFAMGWREQAECYRRDDREVIEKGESRLLIEELQTTSSGETIHLLTSKVPLRDTQEAVIGVLGTYMDVSDMKRAEAEREKLQAQLLQAQKMEAVGRLAGGVAHDFNNMLGIIIGHADIVLEQMDPDHPFHADLTEIRKAGARSADLTRQLLAFARKQIVAPMVIDLNETVEGMLKMLRRLIGEDIDMAWIPGENVWLIKIDPGQIDQILANLCVNARDAIAGVGKMTIETGNTVFDEAYCRDHGGFVPGEYAMLAVSDNGCGMDSETMLHLFEPFFTTKELGKGTGLGLATVCGAVKQNKGLINVYSEPGQGTTFKIYLPRHLPKTVPLPEKGPDKPSERSHETVLLVEDEPAILEMTTRMLEREGYTVVAAGTPGEAIRLANEHIGDIHLLLTDVVMPEMNGRDLAKNILSLYPRLKCLFMSGFTANVIAHHGVLDKGVNFIQKPFSMAELTVKVRKVLDRD